MRDLFNAVLDLAALLAALLACVVALVLTMRVRDWPDFVPVIVLLTCAIALLAWIRPHGESSE